MPSTYLHDADEPFQSAAQAVQAPDALPFHPALHSAAHAESAGDVAVVVRLSSGHAGFDPLDLERRRDRAEDVAPAYGEPSAAEVRRAIEIGRQQRYAARLSAPQQRRLAQHFLAQKVARPLSIAYGRTTTECYPSHEEIDLSCEIAEHFEDISRDCRRESAATLAGAAIYLWLSDRRNARCLERLSAREHAPGLGDALRRQAELVRRRSRLGPRDVRRILVSVQVPSGGTADKLSPLRANRPRGAGRPRARAVARSSSRSGDSGDDPGDPEPDPPARSGVLLQLRAATHTKPRAAHAGGWSK